MCVCVCVYVCMCVCTCCVCLFNYLTVFPVYHTKCTVALTVLHCGNMHNMRVPDEHTFRSTF